jgi:hypothetical protein
MELAAKIDIEASNSSSAKRHRQFKLNQNRLVTVAGDVLQRYGLNPSLLGEEHSAKGSEEASRCRYW